MDEIPICDINTVKINVSGSKFEIGIDTLAKKPDTRLGKLALSLRKKFMSGEDKTVIPTIFYSRSASAFESVLYFYVTNELHLPTNVCPMLFKSELEFWGLDTESLVNCCRFKFFEFANDFATTSAFHDSIRQNEKVTVNAAVGSSLFWRVRARLWSILDQEESTMISRIVMWAMLTFVAISIATLSLGTVEYFQTDLNQCELRDHLDKIAHDVGVSRDTIILMKNFNCSVTVEQIEEELFMLADEEYIDYSDWTHVGFSDKDDIQTASNKLKSIPKYKKRYEAFLIIDLIMLAFFTVELILRLCTCPHLMYYFLSVPNVIDVIILVATYVDLIIETKYEKYRYEDKGLKIFFYLQMLRVLRILRYVQHVPSIRVLGYTMRTNFKDLLVLLLYVLIGVILFSNFVYFAESKSTFYNIPVSWWWGIITMTTVGYGDIVPQTVIGKIIGSLCALSGVLVLSLVIPVFVNTFISLYNFSHLYERFLKNDNKTKPIRINVIDIKSISKKTGTEKLKNQKFKF